jgi:cob(I)alamin adenosyltransferase
MTDVERNGWAEYQKLVLAELERHNVMIADVANKIQDISLQLAIMKQEAAQRQNTEKRVQLVEQKIDLLQRGDLVDRAIKRYKKWVLGILVGLVAALAAPIIKAFWG